MKGYVKNLDFESLIFLVCVQSFDEAVEDSWKYADQELIDYLKSFERYEDTKKVISTPKGDAVEMRFIESDGSAFVVYAQSIGNGGSGAPNLAAGLQLFDWKKFIEWLNSLTGILKIIVIVVLAILGWRVFTWLKLDKIFGFGR